MSYLATLKFIKQIDLVFNGKGEIKRKMPMRKAMQ